MSRVDRRLLAWVLSFGVGCLGAAIALREVWPEVSGMFSSPGGGGLGAVSVGIPSLGVLLVVVNIVLGVIVRRRGGRAARIGVVCAWTWASSWSACWRSRSHRLPSLNPWVPHSLSCCLCWDSGPLCPFN